MAKKCCTSLEGGQVFYAWKHSDVVDYNGVKIDGQLPIELKVKVRKREVRNLLIYAAKLWTLLRLQKDAIYLYIGIDVINHYFRVFTAEDIFITVLHANKKAI